jgi:glutamyl-tRNA reductase
VTGAHTEPDLIALVVHARDVASETREAFAQSAAAIAQDRRAILLHTCHRAELYVADEGALDHAPLVLPGLPEGGRRLEGLAVAGHVFASAAGLDSVVIGEDQILHQLRTCLTDRHLAHYQRPLAGSAPPPRQAIGLHPVLERLFQIALQVGRETRSQREGPPLSLADVALERFVLSTGPLLGRRLLIVGAGRMARLAATSASRQGAAVFIANRSRDRAAALAFDVNGELAAYGSGALLPAVDGVLLAISGTWPLSPSAREGLMAAAIPVVDLSTPPAIDAELQASLGPRYTSVDDLARGPREQLALRTRRRFERALEEAEARFEQWHRARSAVPAIRALSDRAEQHRVEELERLFRRADLPDHQRELVEQMSRRLVAGLLHRPLVMLRQDADGDLERAARALFSL